MARDERIRLGRGRLMGYLDEGPRDGTPVLFCHGSPGCRLGALPLVEAVTARGGRIIAPDRPGLGLSEPQRGRSVAGWADDVAEITNRLGLARFRLLAVAGGGPFALVTAWALPDRVEGVALLSSSASFDVPGATDGMSRRDRFLWRSVRWSPRVAGWMLARMASAAARDPIGFTADLAASLGEADRAALGRLDPDARSGFARELAEAMREGTRGAIEDMRLVRAPWGFGVQDVRAPVHVWHGGADRATPMAMGGWLAAMLPRATPHFERDAGHLSTILDHAGDAADWLLVDQEEQPASTGQAL